MNIFVFHVAAIPIHSSTSSFWVQFLLALGSSHSPYGSDGTYSKRVAEKKKCRRKNVHVESATALPHSQRNNILSKYSIEFYVYRLRLFSCTSHYRFRYSSHTTHTHSTQTLYPSHFSMADFIPVHIFVSKRVKLDILKLILKTHLSARQ